MRATEALLLAAHDEDAVLATATNLLGEHFGYGTRAILLYDKAADELVMARAAGPGAADPAITAWRRKLGEGLSGVAAKTRTVVNVGDLWADPRTIWIGPGQVSRVCVPMLVRDELLGVVVVESPRKGAFSPRDEEILTAISQVTALALIHARADQRRRSDIAQLQAVNEVATAAASLDLDASLRAAVEGFQRVTTSDSTAIYLWDEAKSELVLAKVIFDPAYYPADYEATLRAKPLALGEGMIGWAAEHRQAAVVDDAASDTPAQPVSGAPLGSKAAIVVPLVVEDHLLGVVRAVKMADGVYGVDHFRFAQTVASQIALLLSKAQADREQRQRFIELSAVHEVSRRLSEAARLGEVLSYVLDGAIRLTSAEAGLIWRFDDQGRFFLAASQNIPAERVSLHPPNATDSVSHRILASGRPLRLADAQTVGRGRWPVEVPHLHALLGIPLRSEGRAYGSLLVLHREKDFFRPENERILEVIAAQAAAAIARAEALEEAQRLAITDALTGLYNARYFTGRLESEIDRSRRYGHSLALLIVDSDALKLVNDKLGHAAGNDLLVDLARTIQRHVRTSDLVARFGGDEFVILQPESSLEAAVATADRIRLAAYAASDVAGVERSVSAGVAMFPQNAPDSETLFQQADAALYRAKRAGKNRVEAAPA
ncbi:MAG: GAF domain-containing protein [Chloroflexota bacterium]|nr:GAF domain-containing protein [Chloroflexota bacterium]MDE3192996.1 GAF domain-containing protein [Chloroflexota bacterium]